MRSEVERPLRHPAAESWYQDSVNNAAAPTYTGLVKAKLLIEAPGIGAGVKAIALNSGKGYCVEDTEATGHVFSYIGGDPGTSIVATAPAIVATVETGDCATTTGVTGAA